jgi:F-type H+-transporting ATPase subunit gamma
MFAARTFTPIAQQAPAHVRNMATLKEISRRLAGVKNMQKITKAMKMVAASKLRVAERNMKPARHFGSASARLTDKVDERPEIKQRLVLAVTTDRGLCGGVNTAISKVVKRIVAEDAANGIDTKVAIIGDKGRQQLGRVMGKDIIGIYNEMGRQAFNYSQASFIANDILENEFKFDECTIVHNKYRTAIAYDTNELPILSAENMKKVAGAKLVAYQAEGDPDILDNYQAHTFANAIYMAFSENYTVEQSSRMNAMEGASGNATDMIASLELTYNRTRQAVITRELIEIISGASAL